MQDCSISSVLAVEILTHYSDIIISMLASQITSILLVQSTVFSGADQRKHQSSASLAFVRVIHWLPVNSLHKGPVTQKMFHMMSSCAVLHEAVGIYLMPCLFSFSTGHTVPIWRSRSLRSENRRERHGRLMKSWQHRTDILEVCSVGKRSAVIGKPVRQSFTVKLCHVGRDCGYDLFIDRFQLCVESETSWDCRTQCEGICGQRVGIRGQRMDGREDRINITTTSCLIDVTFMFLYISRYAYTYLCIF